MLVPDDALMSLPMMFGMTFAMRARVLAPPQAVPAPAAKEEAKKK
jgi:hypothetical protein